MSWPPPDAGDVVFSIVLVQFLMHRKALWALLTRRRGWPQSVPRPEGRSAHQDVFPRVPPTFMTGSEWRNWTRVLDHDAIRTRLASIETWQAGLVNRSPRMSTSITDLEMAAQDRNAQQAQEKMRFQLDALRIQKANAQQAPKDFWEALERVHAAEARHLWTDLRALDRAPAGRQVITWHGPGGPLIFRPPDKEDS